ncbi:MAG: MFS transporter [Rickettsiales bacterium]|jgi:MFS family permease|nr:MFS transporter [Rickettsiales bacterium]
MKPTAVKKALRLLKWGEFFKDFMLVLPVVTLLYQSRGITIGEFFLIQGLFRIASLLFEIPSGYMSDAMSRRKVLLSGAIIWFAAIAGLFWAHGFWWIAACEMMMGISYALFSGTEEAYAYDLLKRMNREKDFVKENGGIMAFSQTSSLIAVLIGGYLYAIVGEFVIAIEAAAALLAVICMWQLPELPESKRKIAPESSPLRDLACIVKMSATHPEIKWFMMFTAIFGSFAIVLMWIMQPAMAGANVPVAMFGIFLGLNQFSRVAFSKFAHRFAGRGVFLAGIIMVAAAILAVVAMPHAGGMTAAAVYALCAIVAIAPAIQSLCKLTANGCIHKRINSTERGTVISVGGMLSMLLGGGMLILMKPLLDRFGIQTSMLIALAMFSIILIPTLKILRMKL